MNQTLALVSAMMLYTQYKLTRKKLSEGKGLKVNKLIKSDEYWVYISHKTTTIYSYTAPSEFELKPKNLTNYTALAVK